MTVDRPHVRERSSQRDWTPPASGLPMLLVALGTIYTAKPEFLANEVEAMRGEPWHVVMALSHRRMEARPVTPGDSA